MNVKGSSEFPGGFKYPMTLHEAKLILNLENKNSLTIQEINSNFAKMMLQNHPDCGGSSLIANKMIEARDLLTNSYKK